MKKEKNEWIFFLNAQSWKQRQNNLEKVKKSTKKKYLINSKRRKVYLDTQKIFENSLVQ